MKKILVTTLVACALVSSALAQGLITFSATGTSTTDWVPGMIGYKAPGVATATLVPASVAGAAAQVGTYGNLNIALYGAPVGTALTLKNGVPDLTNWKIASPILQVLAAKGYMTSKSVTMDANLGAPGTQVQLAVVAWTGSATTFGAAASDPKNLLAWSGDANSGGALTWANGTQGLPPSLPVPIVKGASAFNGLVLAPVPEPSTFALAGLGAAALLIFRRRQ